MSAKKKKEKKISGEVSSVLGTKALGLGLYGNKGLFPRLKLK